MRIKLTKMQLDGVAVILNELVNHNKPVNMAEKLVYHFVKSIYNKIRVKSESLTVPRSGWSISLTDQEAISLYLFLNQVYIPVERYNYEHIQLLSICSEIEKQHG